MNREGKGRDSIQEPPRGKGEQYLCCKLVHPELCRSKVFCTKCTNTRLHLFQPEPQHIEKQENHLKGTTMKQN